MTPSEILPKQFIVPIVQIGDYQKIFIGNKHLAWLSEEIPKPILSSIGLEGFSLKIPCSRRINFINNEIKKLNYLFSRELEFITEYTSSVYWIETNENNVGSAGFYEIPNCTFFSDTAMFSLPPEILVPHKHAAYAIFENFYHEALHHQMHGIFNGLKINYLKDKINSSKEYSISWRARTFTLTEAFHALHVYSTVTPFRARYLENMRAQDKSHDEINWLNKAYEDSLRMWYDLIHLLQPHIEMFEAFWAKFIDLWRENYQLFSYKYSHTETKKDSM